MVDITAEYKDALKAGAVQRYLKSDMILARPAETKENVNGVVASPGDFVVKDFLNAENPDYIISKERLLSRYRGMGLPYETYERYRATGDCFAFQYKGKEFTYDTPWKEKAICATGDFIISMTQQGSDIYHHSQETFKRIYIPYNSPEPEKN